MLKPLLQKWNKRSNKKKKLCFDQLNVWALCMHEEVNGNTKQEVKEWNMSWVVKGGEII